MTLQVTILAAGMGTRLGRPWPKPLTPLRDGRSIMAQQMDNIRSALDGSARVTVVVGFKLELIMEAFNAFNHANLNKPDRMIGSADNPNLNAGRIVGSTGGRVVQLGLRFSF